MRQFLLGSEKKIIVTKRRRSPILLYKKFTRENEAYSKVELNLKLPSLKMVNGSKNGLFTVRLAVKSKIKKGKTVFF